jgi:glycerophosphoryl diester phosphodiesterase
MALVIAHRGWSGRYPENTLPAIRAALRLGVDMVEIDVQETRDGKLVVFHDDRLDRIYGVHKRVRDAARRELPNAPALGQVLRACRGKANVLVEIKRADPIKVAREIERAGMEQQVIVFSFSVPLMEAFANANPAIPRFALFDNQIPRKLPVTVRGLGLNRQLITSRRVVNAVHRRGWKLFVWTVNRTAEMRRFVSWGVDGIISDHPDRVKSCLAR